MTLTTRLVELLTEVETTLENIAKGRRYLVKLRDQVRAVRRQVELSSRPAPAIYARLKTFEVECPRCHTLLVCGSGRKKTGHWDSPGRTLRCPKCQAVYTPAIVLYRRYAHIGVPADQLADERMRAQIHAGYLMPERLYKHPERSNIVMPEGCTCGPGDHRAGVVPGCEIHGRLTS